jgi:hypothetical protein
MDLTLLIARVLRAWFRVTHAIAHRNRVDRMALENQNYLRDMMDEITQQATEVTYCYDILYS